MLYCKKSSISHLIICWCCPNIACSQLVLWKFSNIKLKTILACLLNASIEAKNEEEVFVTAVILDGNSIIDKRNIVMNRL